MNILCDLLIVAIVVLCAVVGKKQGFIKAFFGLFGSLISFVLASVIARPVGSFLGSRVISPVLKEYFSDVLTEAVGTAAEQIDFSQLPPACDEILRKFGTDTASIAAFLEAKSEGAGNTVGEVSSWVVEPLASGAGFALAFIVLFVAFLIAIRIAVRVLDLISKLPILNFSNHFLGLGMGLLWGLFLAVLLSSVLDLAAPLIQENSTAFFRNFDPEGTVLIKWLSRLDLLDTFVATKG
ncbi:MAG: CvpA family protein [Clostridia bacterium]|nr:CvpA family protein [Clostridia bacterium]